MRERIGKDLLDRLESSPAPKRPVEFYDLELKGFTLRVQPSGQKSFYLRYRTLGGRQTRVVIGSLPTTTLTTARKKAGQLLLEIGEGKRDPAAVRKEARAKAQGDPTLQELLDDHYGPAAEKTLRFGKDAVSRVRSRFPALLNTRLRELDSDRLRAWRTERMKDKVKATTINKDVLVLSGALSYAVDHGLLEVHPLRDIKPLKAEDNRIVRFLSEAEERRLRMALDAREQRMRDARLRANSGRKQFGRDALPVLDGAFADHLKPMVLVSMNTGVRQGELLSLAWRDVDLDHSILRVHAHFTKNRKTRHIPLNSEAAETLAEWKAQRPHAISTDFVFPGRSGGRMQEVKTAWGALLTAAKIETFRWHDLRHHFASRLVMAGVDLNKVRELLGHGSLAMTLRYAHLAPEHTAEAVERIVSQDRNAKQAKVVSIHRRKK